jgi:hypothetical protein
MFNLRSTLGFMQEFKPFETSSLWIFIDPDTQYEYRADSRPRLVQIIVGYRAQNKLSEIEHLDWVIDNYLCGLSRNAGKCREKRLSRGIMQYLKGGVALVQNMMFPSFASQEEAERRADICMHCSCNVFLDRGPFIRWSDEIAAMSVGERKVSVQEGLGNCEVCSCCLKAKVHYPGPFELSDEEKEKMKDCNPQCWQIEKED